MLERLRNPPRDALTSTPVAAGATILGHLADGLTNRQIAAEMFLAEKTVKNYVSNLLGKLGMTHRTQAAVYAAGWPTSAAGTTGPASNAARIADAAHQAGRDATGHNVTRAVVCGP